MENDMEIRDGLLMTLRRQAARILEDKSKENDFV